MEYIRNPHSVYLLTYHIVFVTKYRRPVIDDRISAFLKDHISYLCSRFDAELLTAETDRDHIHLLISMPPKLAPAVLIRVLKTQTAKEIHLDPEMDAHVKKYIYGNAPLWQPSYSWRRQARPSWKKLRNSLIPSRQRSTGANMKKPGDKVKKGTADAAEGRLYPADDYGRLGFYAPFR